MTFSSGLGGMGGMPGGMGQGPFPSFPSFGGMLPGQGAPSAASGGGRSGADGGSGGPSGMSKHAPTTREFQDAATDAYGMGYGLGRNESNLKPLMENGRPVERTNPATGMVSKAYVTPDDNVIVAFGGTTSGMMQNPGILGPQLTADLIAGTGGVAPAQTDAANFTREVQGIADRQGIGSQNVYVTGHSLGGMESQYAAQQTGAGGMAFETPGIRPDPNAPGKGDNFVTVSDQSDPVAMVPFGGPHYGRELNVNTGMGLIGHFPGSQTAVLGRAEGMSLPDLLRQLQSA